jgi:cytidine deaminase
VETSDSAIEALRRLAVDAAAHAYCPYSNFAVGAAVLTSDGTMHAGANIENASFGLTNCAERSAIFAAASAGHHKVRVVVVYTPTPEPTLPCGSCRQVINEFGPDAEILCFGRAGEPRRYRLAELLPGAFGPNNLTKLPSTPRPDGASRAQP